MEFWQEVPYFRYTYSIWPTRGPGDQTMGIAELDKIVISLMGARFEAYYSEEDFHKARLAMLKIGWQLHNIEKWDIVEPYHMPEILEEVQASFPDDWKERVERYTEPEDQRVWGREFEHNESHPSQF